MPDSLLKNKEDYPKGSKQNPYSLAEHRARIEAERKAHPGKTKEKIRREELAKGFKFVKAPVTSYRRITSKSGNVKEIRVFGGTEVQVKGTGKKPTTFYSGKDFNGKVSARDVSIPARGIRAVVLPTEPKITIRDSVRDAQKEKIKAEWRKAFASKKKSVTRVEEKKETGKVARLIRATAKADIGVVGDRIILAEKTRREIDKKVEKIKNKIKNSDFLSTKEKDVWLKKFSKSIGRKTIDWGAFGLDVGSMITKATTSVASGINYKTLNKQDKKYVLEELKVMHDEGIKKARKDITELYRTLSKAVKTRDPEAVADVVEFMALVALAKTKKAKNDIKAIENEVKKTGQTTLRDQFKKIREENKKQAKKDRKERKKLEKKIKSGKFTKEESIKLDKIADAIEKQLEKETKVNQELGNRIRADLAESILKEQKARMEKIKAEKNRDLKQEKTKIKNEQKQRLKEIKELFPEKKYQKIIDIAEEAFLKILEETKSKKAIKKLTLDMNTRLNKELSESLTKKETTKKTSKTKKKEEVQKDRKTADSNVGERQVTVLEEPIKEQKKVIKETTKTEQKQSLKEPEIKTKSETKQKEGLPSDKFKIIDKRAKSKIKGLIMGRIKQNVKKQKTATNMINKTRQKIKPGTSVYDSIKEVVKEYQKLKRNIVLKQTQTSLQEFKQFLEKDKVIKEIIKINAPLKDIFKKLPPLSFKLKKQLKEAIELAKKKKKKKGKFTYFYTPTLAGLGEKATYTSGKFVGFETRGNVILLKNKPVHVKSHKRKTLVNVARVRKHRRRKPHFR